MFKIVYNDLSDVDSVPEIEQGMTKRQFQVYMVIALIVGLVLGALLSVMLTQSGVVIPPVIGSPLMGIVTSGIAYKFR
jgi:hypothetical protein